MKRRILFVSSNYSSFVKQDAEALAAHCELVRFEFGSRKGFSMIVQQFKLLAWLLLKLPGSKGIFIWFADYHSLLPVWMGKIYGVRSFLVIGGYDAARLPEYNYGGHNKQLRSWFIRKSCKAASTILHVSAFVKSKLESLIGGIASSKSLIVYNGVDTSLFRSTTDWSSRQGVICVAFADNGNRARIKGLDRFMDLATRMPNVSFALVGVTGSYLEEIQLSKPKNLTLMGAVPRQELEALYNQAKVVCLLSRFESFGMSLAEGMLCGCVPVTMDGIGAAEIVNTSCGFTVNGQSQEDIITTLELALRSTGEFSQSARRRILDHFSQQRRSEQLVKILGIK